MQTRIPARIKISALAAFLMVAAVPSLAYAQNDQVPRLAEPRVAAPSVPRNVQLERRFLESAPDWSFYHRTVDIPETMRDVLFKVATRSIVDTGESFDAGDIRLYGRNAQHLFTASSGDLWVMVWYAGSFNGPTLHALIYDQAAGDGYEYDFRSAVGAISLEPELKDLIRTRQGGVTKYYPAGTL